MSDDQKNPINISEMRERFNAILSFADRPMNSEVTPAEILGVDTKGMKKQTQLALARMERNSCVECAVKLTGDPAKFECKRCDERIVYKLYYDNSNNVCSSDCSVTDTHTHFSCKCGDIIFPGVVRYTQTRYTSKKR